MATQMPAPKTLKKSESLEIRIPYPTKTAFMDRCRQDGRSASDTLRDFIDHHLDGPVAKPKPKHRRRHLIAGAVIAAAVGAIALPSLARPSLRSELVRLTTPRPAFQQIDTNGDGVISPAEYARFER